jgi:hypothetical protein
MVGPIIVIMVTLKNLGNRHHVFMGLYDEAKRSEHQDDAKARYGDFGQTHDQD